MEKLPKLELYLPSLMPCSVKGPNVVSVLNTGAKSKGISVIFSGNYIENDDLIISNAVLQTVNNAYDHLTNSQFQYTPFNLKKEKRGNEWIYYGDISDFEIPEKVPDKLGPKKAADLEFERAFTIRFDVNGNSRKLLDITVQIIPKENLNGACTWYCWREYPSKKEYIQSINKQAQQAEELFGVQSTKFHLKDYDL